MNGGEASEAAFQAFWPGPLSIVGPARRELGAAGEHGLFLWCKGFESLVALLASRCLHSGQIPAFLLPNLGPKQTPKGRKCQQK